MKIAGTVFVLLVALIHVYILWLEMFAWATPRGRAAFGTTEAFASESKVLAAQSGPLQRISRGRSDLGRDR